MSIYNLIKNVAQSGSEDEEYQLDQILSFLSIHHACGGAVDDGRSQMIITHDEKVYAWDYNSFEEITDDKKRLESILFSYPETQDERVKRDIELIL